jgi:ESCRT-II complex subunit VPS25
LRFGGTKQALNFVNHAELAGIDSIILMRALRLLEQKGKAAIFKVNDCEGVKFYI